MKNFFIVANLTNKDAKEAAVSITEYIRSKGGKCFYVDEKSDGSDNCSDYRYTNPALVPDDTECFIVLGGDGTILQAARDLMEFNLPFIGINYGNLGFLARIDRDDILPTIDMLFDNKYTIDDRMMLMARIIRNGKIVNENIALNDIVINRSGLLRIIDFNVTVNDQYLAEYKADGMIISTPTGSTAYNMSAGGPIIKPSAKVMSLTPICPHTFNTRSIILEADDEIVLEILPSRERNDRIVAYDGDNEFWLEDGDKIVITKADRFTQIIKLDNLSFLQVLRRKMSGNENN